ncbi:unnamed protein product, partial [Didymodactylos carnosus]
MDSQNQNFFNPKQQQQGGGYDGYSQKPAGYTGYPQQHVGYGSQQPYPPPS